MVIGVGIDIVSNKRFLNCSEELVNRILHEEELAIYHRITDLSSRAAYIGSRFACKEALFKAFEKGDKTTNYKDIAILNYETGKPYVKIEGHDDIVIHVSLSHEKEYSIGYVMLEKV